MLDELPYLNLAEAGFSTRGPEVLAARDTHWGARTPWGLAVLRHREAGMLLRDRRLRQGSHAWPRQQGLSGSFTDFWERSIIGQEGETHKRLRHLALPALAEDFILSLVPEFEATAAGLAEGFRDGSCFVESFTQPFAGRAITTLLGLPAEQSVWIARDANSLGLAMGVGSGRHEAEINGACDRLTDLARRMLSGEEPVTQASLVRRLQARAEELGGVDEQTLVDLIVIAIFGGVDTTRAQLAFALALFIQNPDQWRLLRDNPDLIPQAIEEVVRTRPTTTWATREALEHFEFGGVDINAGTTIHVLVHATGTDPLISADDGFDITKRRKMHFGFGGGAHHCMGQLVARTDIGAALRVLVRRWERFEFAEPPEWLPDSGNTAPVRMALNVVRA